MSSDRPVNYTSEQNVRENVSKFIDSNSQLSGTNIDRPSVFSAIEDLKPKSLSDESGLSSVNLDRPFVFDDIINVQGDLLYVDINSSLFNVDNYSITMPVDLSSVLYKGMRVYFISKNNSSFDNSGLIYNFPYYVKELNTVDSTIELYLNKTLINRINFSSGGTGTHQLVLQLNPNKFESESFLPYALTLDDLNKKFTEIYDNLIQLESDDPDSFEKIVQDISNKYISYFDLGEEIVTELISEFGYGYLTEIGLNLGTSELSIFYSYLKLFHLLKGTRQGLELVFQLLGYEAKLVEWWEMPNLSVFPLGEPATFDLIIKIVDEPTLTLLQSGKIRTFTRHYVYPLLRYIIQDILLEFTGLGLGSAGFTDKIFEFDSSFNTLVFSSGGFSDTLYDSDLLLPSFESVVPFQYDNSEGESGFLSLGQTSEYLVLDNNVVNGVVIYLSNASVTDNVQFSLKRNGVQIVSPINLTLLPTQNLLNFSTTFIINLGDTLTLTVETLDILDTSVGDSLIWGFYG